MRSRSLAGSMLIAAGMTVSVFAQTPTPKPTTTPAPTAGRQTAAPAAATKDIPVTVMYTGKGTVDADHQIVVFLFNEATVGPQSHPIGSPQYVTKNGQTVTFKDVPENAVYILGIYGGKYDGRGGPPPAGTPIGFYSKDGKAPTAVTPGAKVPVKLTFDEAKKFGQ